MEATASPRLQAENRATVPAQESRKGEGMNPVVRDPSPASKRHVLRWAAVLLVLLVGIALNVSDLYVTLPTGDESGYLLDGASLVEQGKVLAIGSGPLPSLVNGLLDLPFRGDHLRLGWVSTIRRFLTYGVILMAVWWAARRVGGETAGWVALVLAAVGRPVSVALDNSADALYTSISALAFALGVGLVVDLLAERKTVAHWRGSAFAVGAVLGVSALARLDGLALGLLVAVVALATGILGRRPVMDKQMLCRMSLFALAGLALPVAGWIVVSGLLRGNWDTQILARSYLAFEQGHNFLYSGQFNVPPPVSADQLYGTAAANHYSVLLAVAHHPRAFVARIPLVLANAVRMYENSYGIVSGLLVLLLALAGAVYLATVSPVLLGFTGLWFVPLLGYLLASYRPGFFSTVYPELLVLLGAGVAAAIRQLQAFWDQAALRPPLFAFALLLLLVVGGNMEYGAQQDLAWIRGRGTNPELQWVKLLAQNIPRGNCLISYDTADAIYANLRPNNDWMTFFDTHTASALVGFMQSQDCHYVEVDGDLVAYAPHYAQLVESTLVLQFSSPDGTRKIYSDRR